MDILVKHSLATDEVKKRLQNLAVELKKQYGSQLKDYTEEWIGNKLKVNFKAMGFKLGGILEIFDDRVEMNGKVPLMLKSFEGQVRDTITKTLVDLLK